MKYILNPATFPPSPIYHYPAQITTLCCLNHEGKYQTNPCFLLSPSSVYSLSSQHKLFKMLSLAMQLLVSSKPSTAPHRHLKYIPLPPTPTFKAPHDQAPATLPCLFCSISKLAIFLFLEQPHFHLPLRGMLFPQICTWLAPWIEIQEHCSV